MRHSDAVTFLDSQTRIFELSKPAFLRQFSGNQIELLLINVYQNLHKSRYLHQFFGDQGGANMRDQLRLNDFLGLKILYSLQMQNANIFSHF